MLALQIASRYLFAPKSHRAINAITVVAAVGVGIITAALICTLSVYNGFERLVGDLCSAFDPDVRIEAARGKTFHASAATLHALRNTRGVAAVSQTLDEDVLLTYANRQIAAHMKGVDADFRSMCQLDLPELSPMTAALGVGLAAQLRAATGGVVPLTVYCPRRVGTVSLLHPDDAFRQREVYPVGMFAVSQADYDDQVVLTDLTFARTLLDDSLLTSAYEVRLAADARPASVMADLRRALDTTEAGGADGFRLLTGRQLHADAYRIMQIEKWVTFLLVAFILLIASFNIIGALSMLIIDKQPEIVTLRTLGATDALVRRIFIWEGWLISGTGAAVGLTVGIAICLLQEHVGFIPLGDGSDLYIVDTYPMHLVWTDVVWTALSVAAIGLMVSLVTARQLRRA